jgi:hypothetical protein
MPSLFRFLIVLVVLGILGGAGMIYLALFVGPHTREMSVRIPTERLHLDEQPPQAAGPQAQQEPPAEQEPQPAPAQP